MNIQELIEKTDNAIAEMGVKPEEARGQEPGQWLLMRDEIPIYLDAWTEDQSTPWNYFIFGADPTVFQVTIPFCYGPTLKKAEFLEELLTVNINLLYGKFSYNAEENVVVLVYRVPGSALDPSQIGKVIEGLGYYAEMTYHVLKDEFHLKRVLVTENQ
ncbi:MAG: hypothetical protein JNL57_10555 [Bacteroidetes bacterium]|nr:hypothetical protein [Bacteroidota bacterium]